MIEEQDLVYAFDADVPLPNEWQITTIEGLITDAGLFCDGDWVESKDQDPDGDVRLIQLADIGVASYRDRSDRYLTSERATALSCTFLKRGDILIARMPDPLGRACIFPGDTKRAVTVVDVAVVRPSNPAVDTRWLMHRINSMAFRNAVASLQSGSTRLRISRRNLSKIAFSLPPLAVQLATVDELEKQFSRLDEAVANLQRVKANLKRYKASVLKAAVEGRLVETEASLAHREGRTYETGEQLLQRLLEERRAKWAGKGKFKEPVPCVAVDGELSLGWSWAAYSQLGDVTTGFTPPTGDAANFGGITPFFKPTDLDAGDNVHIAREYLTDAGLQKGRKLPAGSVLITCIGATIGKTGLAAVDCATNQQINSVSPVADCVDSRYLFWWTSSPKGQEQIVDNASATTLPILNKSKFEALSVALPPFAEQIRIVAEVDRHLSIVREVEAEVDTDLQRAQALRQATLATAFGLSSKP